MSRFYKSNLMIINELRSYIDGLMLSDGHIELKSSKTGRYCQLCKNRGWLDFINTYFYDYDIDCSVDVGKLYFGGKSKKDGSLFYNLRTFNYTDFKEMHDIWYIKDYNVDDYSLIRWHLNKRSNEYFVWKKVIPKDITLTPECVANWYIGDGNLFRNKGNYQILLATNDFSRDDIIFLTDYLSELLDIKCTVNKSNVVGIYTQYYIYKFLDYIKDYKVDCYNYKFINTQKESEFR